MPLEFPVPVLSVAKDAVRELEGREALSSLWALFTKCKESIKDGRRLENLSWRLWYRDMVFTEKESLKDFWSHDAVLDEKLIHPDSSRSSLALNAEALLKVSQASTSVPTHVLELSSWTPQATPSSRTDLALQSIPRENGDIHSKTSLRSPILPASIHSSSNTTASSGEAANQNTNIMAPATGSSLSPSLNPAEFSSSSTSSSVAPQSATSPATFLSSIASATRSTSHIASQTLIEQSLITPRDHGSNDDRTSSSPYTPSGDRSSSLGTTPPARVQGNILSPAISTSSTSLSDTSPTSQPSMHLLHAESALSDTSDCSHISVGSSSIVSKKVRRSSFQGRMIFELLPPPTFGISPASSASPKMGISASGEAFTPGRSGSSVKDTTTVEVNLSVPVEPCVGKFRESGENVINGEEEKNKSQDETRMVFRLKGQLLTPTASMSGDEDGFDGVTKERLETILVSLPATTSATVASQLPTPGYEYDEPQATGFVGAPPGLSSPAQASTTTSAVLSLQLQLPSASEATPPAKTAIPPSGALVVNSTASTPTSGSIKVPASTESVASSVNGSLHAPTPSSVQSASQQMTLTLPKLIIVHPTPGPTPHPTPPATPRFLMEVETIAIPSGVVEESLLPDTGAALIPPVSLPVSDAALNDSQDSPLSPELLATPTNTAISVSSPLQPPSEYTLVDEEVIPPIPFTRRSASLHKEKNVNESDLKSITEAIAVPSSMVKVMVSQAAEQSGLPAPHKVASPPKSSSPQKKAARRSSTQTVTSACSGDSAQTPTESSATMSADQQSAHGMARSTSGRGTARPSSRAAIAPRTHGSKTKGKVTIAAAKSKSLSRSRSRGSNVGVELGMATAGLAMTSAAPTAKAASPPNGKARPPVKRSQSSAATVTASSLAQKSPPTPRVPTFAPVNPPPPPSTLTPSSGQPAPSTAADTRADRPISSTVEDDGKSKTGTWGRKNGRPTFNIGSDEGSKSGSSVSAGVVERDRDRDLRVATKGKARLEPPPTATQSNYQQLANLSKPVQHLNHVSAKLQQQQQQQHVAARPPRRIVLASDDEDEEWGTETDIDTESAAESIPSSHANGKDNREIVTEDDEENWSSEALSTDDVHIPPQHANPPTTQASRNAPSPQHQHHHHHQQQQQQQRVNSGVNAAARAKQNARRPQQVQQMTRAQLSRQQHAQAAQHTVEAAAKALHAQRYKEDMFAKKPVPSSEQLAAMRSKSVGLLTQLMNPDPMIFHPAHPYRRNYSSGNVAGFGPTFGMSAMNGEASQQRPHHQRAETETPVVNGQSKDPRAKRNVRRASADDYRIGTPGKAGPAPPFAPGLKPTKSSAALPLASQVMVGSVATVTATAAVVTTTATTSPTPSPNRGSLNAGSSGGYRPRGRPADQEMEESSDEEEEEASRSGLQMSKSVAQLKLQEFAQKRGIKSTDRRSGDAATTENDIPSDFRANGHASQAPHVPNLPGPSRQQPNTIAHLAAQLARHAPAPAPIPMNHPYNLPLAPAPTTPRTTRRQMLQTEMSESLRRNLLWERQVHRQQLVVPRRTQSVLGNQLRPMTTIPAVVEVRPKKPVRGLQPGDIANAERRVERRGSDGAVPDAPQDRDSNRDRALARNRSWANDYHTSGW